MTRTGYAFNKHSANFVRLTLSIYSTIYLGILAVTNRIWDKSGPHGSNKLFSTSFVGILGSNHEPTRSTTHTDKHRLTLCRVSNLLKVYRYLVPHFGELHRKSHQTPPMWSFMVLFYMLCNVRIIRPAFCSPSGRVSGRCPPSTGGEMWLNLPEHTIGDCFCPFNSVSSKDHTVPSPDTPVWWDPQSQIPMWFWEKALIVGTNLGVSGQ
jgi:hypothetical protein